MEIRECLLEQSNMELLKDSTAFNNCAVVIITTLYLGLFIFCGGVNGFLVFNSGFFFLFLYKMDMGGHKFKNSFISNISLEAHRLQLTVTSIFTWLSFFTSVFIWIKKVDIFSHHVNQAEHPIASYSVHLIASKGLLNI